tara:strand:+ start:134 stop:805 length:672 start_codon:yes stop_codon:yes gene_type:complete
MLSRPLPASAKITLHKTSDGYEIRDNEKNMKMSLSFDDYSKILLDNKKHQLNKILKAKNLSILDCTGGFARDAAILASLGNNVTLIDRNPLIMSLLVEAREKIKSDDIRCIFSRIKIRFGNCIEFIRNTNKHFDYIYFDFMFNINKSALPSKNEQFLREIVKNDINENVDIIHETIQRVKSKIIIKEHISSNDYNNFDIINTYKGKTVKYHLLEGKSGYRKIY